MTTFGQWGALGSRAGKRSPLRQTQDTAGLFEFFLPKHVLELTGRKFTSCVGTTWQTKSRQNFSLHLHATEIKSHFCEAPFCLLKIVLLPFEPKGSGPSCALSMWDFRDCLCPIFPSYANTSSIVLNRSELRVSYLSRFCLSAWAGPLRAIVKGFEDHEQILLFKMWKFFMVKKQILCFQV